MLKKLKKYWKSEVSLIIVAAFSIMLMYSNNALGSSSMFIGNLIICFVLGVPTWIFIDLVLHALYKFNTSELFNSDKQTNNRPLASKWTLFFINIAVAIVCLLFLISENTPMNNLLKHIKSSTTVYITPFIDRFLFYFGFWIIVGIIFMVLITRYCYKYDKEIVIHLHLLKIWINPVISIVSIFGLELTAMSSISLKVTALDNILLWFFYFTPMLTILGTVLREWYDVMNRMKKDKKNNDTTLTKYHDQNSMTGSVTSLNGKADVSTYYSHSTASNNVNESLSLGGSFNYSNSSH